MSAQRGERVVGDFSGPDQVPQRVENLRRVSSLGCDIEIAEEGGAPGGEVGAQRLVDPGLGRFLGCGRVQQRDLVPGVERYTAVAGPERRSADPDDLAGRQEIIEHAGLVAHAGRQALGFEDACRQRRAL